MRQLWNISSMCVSVILPPGGQGTQTRRSSTMPNDLTFQFFTFCHHMYNFTEWYFSDEKYIKNIFLEGGCNKLMVSPSYSIGKDDLRYTYFAIWLQNKLNVYLEAPLNFSLYYFLHWFIVWCISVQLVWILFRASTPMPKLLPSQAQLKKRVCFPDWKSHDKTLIFHLPKVDLSSVEGVQI